MNETTPMRIQALLTAAFGPAEIRIRDDSALHAGHAGARSGGGHYHVEIRTAHFSGMPLLARHRAVYGALAPLMGNAIHALSLATLAPDEPTAR
ncbi:MAG TPA: BolA family protein [Candidatus Acidoferrales bacterium]|nr:BolA family protein [Candidatus Acidoferrales bacterium]